MKNLTLLVVLLGSITFAQSNDEPTEAIEIFASDDYNCENAVIESFTTATHSEENACNFGVYDDDIDIWYKFTALEDGKFSFNAESLAGGNPSFRLYTGTPGNLTVIPGGCATRHTTKDMIQGDELYISIQSDTNGDSGGGMCEQFQLCIYKLPEVPANDEATGAFDLLESTYDVCENALEGTTTSSTHSSESSGPATYNDVWYKFTPSQTAEYTIERTILNGPSTTYISIYEGTPGSLTEIPDTFNNSILLVNLEAGKTYYIILISSPNTSQSVNYSLCAYVSPPAPENDECVNSLELVTGETFEENELIGTNVSATVNLENDPLPSCGKLEFEENSRDVWFYAVIPESGNLIIETREHESSTYSSLVDTAMETYTGSCSDLVPYYYQLPPPNQGEAYCNEQFVIGGNAYAGITFTDKTPGDIVFVRVWGWAAQFGKFRISAYDNTPTASVDDINNAKKSTTIYPNPVGEKLFVENKESKIISTTIYSTNAKLVLNEYNKADAITMEVNTVSLSTGTYIIVVNLENGKQETLKFIKS